MAGRMTHEVLLLAWDCKRAIPHLAFQCQIVSCRETNLTAHEDRTMSVLRFVAAVVFFWTSAASGHCGFVTQSGVAGEWQYLDQLQVKSDTFSNFYNVGAMGSLAMDSAGGASAYARVDPIAGLDAGIHLSTTAFSSDANSGLLTAQASAAGQWVDVIRTGSSGPVPGGLRIHVEVEGIVNLQLNSGSRAFIDIGVGSSTSSGLVSALEVPSGSHVSVNLTAPGFPFLPPNLNVNTNGVSNLTAPQLNVGEKSYAGNLSWDTYFDLAYDSSLGGYNVNLYAAVSASSRGGSLAQANFGNTIRITGVTLSDGTDVSNQVTFDSGFTVPPAGGPVTATPAPPGLVLAASGLVTLCGGAWLRRRGRPAVA
jgi:hypothetical protein